MKDEKELKDAALALMTWFQSQEIGPQEALGVMGMVMAEIFGPEKGEQLVDKLFELTFPGEKWK